MLTGLYFITAKFDGKPKIRTYRRLLVRNEPQHDIAFDCRLKVSARESQ